MSDNNNDTSRKKDVVAPSMNREDSPDLQSYKSSRQPSNRVEIVVNIVIMPFQVWKNLPLTTERNIQNDNFF